MAKQRVLGKGLSALIQDAELTFGTGKRREVREIPLEELVCNPNQPRKIFQEEKLNELAASLKDVGMLQPVLVRALQPVEARNLANDGNPPPRYIVIAGERRVRAARMANLATVPALTCSYAEADALRVALLENIQRENLGPIEEAQAFQGLLEAYGATQEELADMLGKNRSTVSNSLRLLSLEEEIRALVEDGTLTRGHAKALLAIPAGADRLRLARLCRSRGLSVREVERRAQGAVAARRRARRPGKGDGARGKTGASPEIRALCARAEAYFGSPVAIEHDARGRGRISVTFYDDGDLGRLLAMMGLSVELD
jgi:ParB family transcriptional regulator, chromosome partitioning protein